MLSRFTDKLTGLSSILGNNNYTQEDIDEAITEIKRLGKALSTPDGEHSGDISKILVLMKRFADSLNVQRVACHALSNLAMQVRCAQWIIEKGGFALIRKALAKFHADHKLCWLASSAVWNLGRPPRNRPAIGREGVRMMLEILHEHRDKEKVANTAIGALSNLSLQDELKSMIAEEPHLHLLVGVMAEHLERESVAVLTSSAGLLANLAVSDEYASTIVSRGALRLLMRLLTWATHGDETLYRNTCAALNNLVTADGFLDAFLRARGAEFVYDFLTDNDNELYANLLENCLANIDADRSVRTSSLHLAALHGKCAVVKELYEADVHRVDLDERDAHRRTPLDYAIAGDHTQVVDFLCRCGAREHSRDVADLSEDMRRAMRSGMDTLSDAKKAHAKAMVVALPHFPEHLCEYMSGFQHHVDMLQGMKLF